MDRAIPHTSSTMPSKSPFWFMPYPTVVLTKDSEQRFILRKRPSGTIISKVAHQVDREYRVLKALGSVEGFPVPKVYCLCMDESVIGTAFYVRSSPSLSVSMGIQSRFDWPSYSSPCDHDAILQSLSSKCSIYFTVMASGLRDRK